MNYNAPPTQHTLVWIFPSINDEIELPDSKVPHVPCCIILVKGEMDLFRVFVLSTTNR